MRGFTAGLFILVGAILTIPASFAIWEQRVLTDRDAFVELGQDVFQEPAVQERLTERITEEVSKVAAANNIALPTSGTSGSLAQGQVRALTGVVVGQLATSPIGEQALAATHEAVLAVIDDDRGRLTSSDDEIRVNLRPAIDEVVTAFQPIVPQLAEVDLPPGTGELVIVQEHDAAIAFRAARWFDGAAWYIALVPAAFYLLAFAIAPNRAMTLLLIGGSLVLAAGARILFYQGPLRSLLTERVADHRAGLAPAAEGVYDVLTASLVAQDMLLVAAGAFCIVAGVIWWAVRRVGSY